MGQVMSRKGPGRPRKADQMASAKPGKAKKNKWKKSRGTQAKGGKKPGVTTLKLKDTPLEAGLKPVGKEPTRRSPRLVARAAVT